jgi:HPt (histidine-containing phosphotransfer) domain-containing protein
MIDKVTFKGMYDNFDKEVIVEIIDIFISEYPERMVSIQEAIQLNDLDNLYRRCHSLKGVIANFYDEDARILAFALEQKGKNGDPSGLAELFEQLKPAAEKLLVELKAIRADYL